MSGVEAGRGPRLVPVRGADGRVGWSLVAANGRRLASAVRAYRNDRELAAGIGELLAERAALRFVLGQREDRLWVWTAHLPARTTRAGAGGGEAIARSARGYLRRDQCRQSVTAFLQGADHVQRLRRLGGGGGSVLPSGW
ncbi:hypothetical protein ACWEPB_36395 [Kitasatospora cineracea]|uniref:hypothetical protein n=1 Tax=Kitasatospora TaxID=2063 RepID=UPI0012FF055C|nr:MULTISPECIES: hypothetical protein [unclassified Kitasatospora]WAL70440.1 hypothetical protein OU787_02360 [Kitasatospora sp. YST-16]WNW36477.1 hypothetical protein RKE32_02355 [Streptomyces sp. Li-HN-5-13]